MHSTWHYEHSVLCKTGVENIVSPSICMEHVNNNTAGKIGDFDSENHDMCEL